MLRGLLLTLCVLLPKATLSGAELKPIGTLPKLDEEWELSTEFPRPENELSKFHWVVFRNKKSGDLLSFAALPPETGKKRGLVFWTDTAHEIFPHGRPSWTEGRNGRQDQREIWPLDSRPSPSSAMKNEVLEYSFVTQEPGRDNSMAHGRVWVSPKGVLFVQHTSVKPITKETVEVVLSDLMRLQLPPAAEKSK